MGGVHDGERAARRRGTKKTSARTRRWSRRYEKKSLVLTTNLLFRDWSTIFPNAMCATALIERVVHHADVIGIQGKSYRTREAEQDTQERAKRRPKPKPKPDLHPEPQ